MWRPFSSDFPLPLTSVLAKPCSPPLLKKFSVPWFSALRLCIADHVLPTLLLYASHTPIVLPSLLSLHPQRCCCFLPVPLPEALAGHQHSPSHTRGLDPATQQGSSPAGVHLPKRSQYRSPRSVLSQMIKLNTRALHKHYY